MKELFNFKNIPTMEPILPKLSLYEELLLKRNQEFNLTSLTSHEDIWVKHFLDSLLPFVQLTKQEEKATLLDIGSGAGFPGIIIALFRPNMKVTVLDATLKKTLFLKELISLLDLNNINVVHARAEEFVKTKRESFDYVTSRGLAKLSIFLELAVPFLKIGGKAIALKGQNASIELNEARFAINSLFVKLVETQDYYLKPLEQSDHRINYVFKKEKGTPLKFPRNYSIITKKPL